MLKPYPLLETPMPRAHAATVQATGSRSMLVDHVVVSTEDQLKISILNPTRELQTRV